MASTCDSADWFDFFAALLAAYPLPGSLVLPSGSIRGLGHSPSSDSPSPAGGRRSDAPLLLRGPFSLSNGVSSLSRAFSSSRRGPQSIMAASAVGSESLSSNGVADSVLSAEGTFRKRPMSVRLPGGAVRMPPAYSCAAPPSTPKLSCVASAPDAAAPEMIDVGKLEEDEVGAVDDRTADGAAAVNAGVMGDDTSSLMPVAAVKPPVPGSLKPLGLLPRTSDGVSTSGKYDRFIQCGISYVCFFSNGSRWTKIGTVWSGRIERDIMSMPMPLSIMRCFVICARIPTARRDHHD